MKAKLDIEIPNSELRRAGISAEEIMKYIATVVGKSASERIAGIMRVGFNPSEISEDDPPPLKAQTPRTWN